MKDELGSRLRALTPEQRELVLERLRSRQASAGSPAAATGAVPAPWTRLSTAQERLYFLDLLDPGNTAYNVPVTIGIHGPLDVPVLRDALASLVARHDALRCVFTQTADGPRQRVTAPGPVSLPLTDLREAPGELDARLEKHARTRIDLENGPVLRAALYRLAEAYHVLHVVVHHVAFDGWSAGLLLGDLAELYTASAHGRAPRLAPVPSGFTEFARWEQGRQHGDRLAAQLRRSRDRLRDAPAALELPSDPPGTPGPGAEGGRLGFAIGPQVTAPLADLARQESTTLYAALLAVFAILLARASGDAEVVVGTPVAGRLRADFEPVIGCFANTLVLRTRPAQARTLRDLLRAVHAEVRAGFADQEVPYARLVEELAPRRVQGRNSLFQVMFGFADLPPVGPRSPGDQEPAGVRFDLESRDQALTDFEMYLSITRRGDGLDSVLVYDSALFHPDTIADFARGYQQLLAQLAAEPDRDLAQFPLLRQGTVAVAATFTPDPVAAPLAGWLRYLGLPATVEIAPYGQVHQQLLARDGLLGRDHDGLAVVLLRWEDWLRDKQAGAPDAPAIGSLTANLAALREAVSAFRAATATPLLLVVCPPSAARAGEAWDPVFAGLLDELAQACAGLPATRVITADGDSTRYPVTSIHDRHGDELASIPYTDEFFAAIAVRVARHLWSLCAPAAAARPQGPAVLRAASGHAWELDPPGPRRLGLVPLFPSRTARIAERPGAVAPPGGRAAPPARVAGDLDGGGTAAVAPRTQTEARLARIWASVLDATEVGVTTSFFSLGGHSLLAVKLLARVRDEFGTGVSLYDLLSDPTVAHIAQVLDAAPAGRAEDGLVPVPRTEPVPLSGTQRRLWALGPDRAERPWHNMTYAVTLEGPLHEEALRAAFATIAERHEALRMIFPADAGGGHTVRVEPPGEAWMARAFPPAAEAQELLAPGELPGQLLADAQAPFDLGQGPLVRVRLLRARPDRHFLLIVMHHGISDYWSWQVFFRELAELYAALRDPSAPLPALPPLALQFGDYAHWQERQAASPARGAMLGRWRELLAGAPPLLALPTDFPRPAVRTGRSGRRKHHLDEPLAARLRAVSRQWEVPLFSVLLAGLALVAERCSGQDTCVVGVPVANRDHDDLSPMIGYLADLIPVRLASRPDRTLRELVREVHEAASASRALAQVPLCDIVDAVNPVRVPGHSPLFQVALNFIDADEERFSLAGLTATPADLPPAGTEYDLLVSVVKAGDALTIDLEYSAELYRPDSAAALAGAFAHVLATVAAEPEATCGAITLPPGFATPACQAGPAAGRGAPPASLLAVAASFPAAPIAPAVAFWGRLFGRATGVALAPEGQVFQQLLEPAEAFGATASAARAVLLRWEDWLRWQRPAGPGERDLSQVVATLERALRDFVLAVEECAAWSAGPLLIGVCPPSSSWSAPPWTTVQAGLLRRLAERCAALDGVHVIAMEREVSAYQPGPATSLAVPAAGAGPLPYTADFYHAMGTVLARWAIAAGTGYRTIVLDPARVFRPAGAPGEGDRAGQDSATEGGVSEDSATTDSATTDSAAAARDELVGWLLRARGLGAGRRVVLAGAGDAAQGPARPDLLGASGAIEWVTVPAGPPPGEGGGGPAGHLRAAIALAAQDPAACVVLDPDPAVCGELRAAFPGLAAVTVPADPALAAVVLRHLWVLDGRPGPATAAGGIAQAQDQILADGLTSPGAIGRAASATGARHEGFPMTFAATGTEAP
jgi:non-ribosomal peptide synthetase component F